jgi:hypothetical protein
MIDGILSAIGTGLGALAGAITGSNRAKNKKQQMKSQAAHTAFQQALQGKSTDVSSGPINEQYKSGNQKAEGITAGEVATGIVSGAKLTSQAGEHLPEAIEIITDLGQDSFHTGHNYQEYFTTLGQHTQSSHSALEITKESFKQLTSSAGQVIHTPDLQNWGDLLKVTFGAIAAPLASLASIGVASKEIYDLWNGDKGRENTKVHGVLGKIGMTVGYTAQIVGTVFATAAIIAGIAGAAFLAAPIAPAILCGISFVKNLGETLREWRKSVHLKKELDGVKQELSDANIELQRNRALYKDIKDSKLELQSLHIERELISLVEQQKVEVAKLETLRNNPGGIKNATVQKLEEQNQLKIVNALQDTIKQKYDALIENKQKEKVSLSQEMDHLKKDFLNLDKKYNEIPYNLKSKKLSDEERTKILALKTQDEAHLKASMQRVADRVKEINHPESVPLEKRKDQIDQQIKEKQVILNNKEKDMVLFLKDPKGKIVGDAHQVFKTTLKQIDAEEALEQSKLQVKKKAVNTGLALSGFALGVGAIFFPPLAVGLVIAGAAAGITAMVHNYKTKKLAAKMQKKREQAALEITSSLQKDIGIDHDLVKGLNTLLDESKPLHPDLQKQVDQLHKINDQIVLIQEALARNHTQDPKITQKWEKDLGALMHKRDSLIKFNYPELSKKYPDIATHIGTPKMKDSMTSFISEQVDNKGHLKLLTGKKEEYQSNSTSKLKTANQKKDATTKLTVVDSQIAAIATAQTKKEHLLDKLARDKVPDAPPITTTDQPTPPRVSTTDGSTRKEVEIADIPEVDLAEKPAREYLPDNALHVAAPSLHQLAQQGNGQPAPAATASGLKEEGTKATTDEPKPAAAASNHKRGP